MTFPEGFFDGMRFKVHGLPEGTDLMKEFPVLQNYKSFKVSMLVYNNADMVYDRGAVLRYIFYCYDLSLQWDVPDLKTKKKQAGKLAGLKTNFIEMLIDNSLPQVNAMILDFLKIQNNRIFTYRVTVDNLIAEYYDFLWAPIDTNADDEKKLKAVLLKAKLIEECEKLTAKIDEIDKELFGSVEEASEIEEIIPVSPQNLAGLEND